MEQPKEYYAFISYKREDEKWAKWLQDKLEHYKFPTNLNGRTDLPKHIRPTFRDVTDLKPGLLAEEINNALQNSEWLIVICSPRSAKSPWVCKEAQTFIDLGRTDHIIPFVIEGNPFSDDTATECYPEALLNLTGSEELLAANINEMGRDAAAIKVIARMFNLRFDVLWQRFEREQQKRRYLIVAATIITFLCLSGLSFWMYWQNQQTQQANKKMNENQIRFLSEKSMYLTDQGDSYTARILALDLLPDSIDEENHNYLPEAEAALRHACAHNSAILRGHENSVNGIHYSSDEKYIISGSYDQTIKLWDASTGICLKTFTGHKDWVIDVDFLADDKRIISYSYDGTVKIWDVRTGKIIKNIEDNKMDAGFCLSPDKKHIIISDNGKLWLYDATTIEPIKSLSNTKDWEDICWYPDGQWISTYTNNHEFIKYNIQTSEIIHIARNYDNDAVIIDHAIDSKGEHIAAAFGTKDGDESFGFEGNGTGYIRIWDTRKGKLLHTLRGGDYWANGVAFSPNNQRLASTSMNGTVRIWDVGSGASIDILKGHSFGSGRPSFSIDGKRLITESGDGTIRIWDIPHSQDSIGLFKIQQLAYTATYHPNGKVLLTTTLDSVSLHDVTTKEWKHTIFKKENDDSIFNSTFSPHGNNVAIISKDNSIKLINMSSLKMKELTGHKKTILSMSFTQDEKYLATASEDKTIRIWNVETGKCQKVIKWKEKVLGVAYLNNEKKIIIESADSTLNVWDLDNSKCIKTWETYSDVFPIEYRPNCIKVSPDEKYVITSIRSNIYVWDIKEGKCVSILQGHNSMIYAFDFSPNGKYIVSCGHDFMTKIWDWKSGVCIMTYYWTQNISAHFSPDNRHVVLADKVGKIRIIYLPPLQELIDQTRERFKNRQLTPEERKKYYLE